MSPSSLAAGLILASTITWPGPLTGPSEPRVVEIAPRAQVITTVTRDEGKAAIVSAGVDVLDARLNANVLFAKDSATILPAGQARLAEIASAAADLPAGRLSITGYTDDLGSTQHGLQLSQERADAVAAALRGAVKAGIALEVTGRGEADPVAPNVDEAHRAQNRRVEIHFTSSGAGAR